MEYKTIILEKKDSIAIITLNRPDKMNTLIPQMADELKDAIEAVDRDEQVKAAVLTASGKAFCAGADLNEWFLPMAKERRKGVPGDWTNHPAEFIPLTLMKLRKPLIAAINGVAIGWGSTVILPCDIRIAAEEAKFSFPFVRVGISPETGASYFLPRIVGLGRASELILTGKTIDAKEAKEIGLVNQVVPGNELLKVASELAASIAKLPPLAVMVSKRLLHQGMDADLTTLVQYESYAINYLWSTEDFEEATRSFLEKRQPNFKGR